MPTHSLKTRALIFCLLLAVIGIPRLDAGGQGEPRLAEVDSLIQKQQYTEALKLLVAIQKDNPDLRDQTTERMAKIRAIMQQFNGLQGEMIQAKSSGDVEAMQKLLPELQKIDPARSSDVSKITVPLVGYLKLMDAAAALLAAGRPAEALAAYLLPLADPVAAGFDLQKPQFITAGYGDVITTIVGGLALKVQSATDQEVREAAALAAVPQALQILLAGAATADSAAAFDLTVGPVVRAAAAEGTVRVALGSLADMGRTISESSSRSTVDPYIQYLIWIIGGRAGKSEGIIRALNLLWAQIAPDVATATAANAMNAFTAARALFDAGTLDAASKALTDARYRFTLAAKAAAVASATISTSSATGWGFRDADTVQSLLGIGLGAQESAAEIDGLQTLIGYKNDLAAMLVAIPNAAVEPTRIAEESASLAAARSRIASRIADAGDQQAAWLARASGWEKKTAFGSTPPALAQSARTVAALFSNFIGGDLQPRDITYALRLAVIGGSGFQRRLDASVAQRRQGEDFMNGTTNGASASDTAEMHPERALPVFTAASNSLDALISDVKTLELKLSAEEPYVTADAQFIALMRGSGPQTGYDGLLKSAQAERAQLDVLSATSLQRIDDAAIASRKGDTAYSLAQDALAKGDPDGAESFLLSATDLYQTSLLSAYSVHAQQRVDKDINTLSGSITKLRNAQAIANADAAITAVNKLIQTKEFLKASDTLTAAENVWNASHTDTYKPFDAIKDSIQNALALSLGRDISPLDAKASYVNAFINSAQINLAAGRLAQARQNVNDALTAAPNYGVAKVLLLQIQKQTDPAAFKTDAAKQIATYVKMAQDSTNRQGQSDAYYALLDYSKLDATFAAQLKPTIQELEYQLGIVPRPATAAQKAQANALLAQANTASQAGTAEGYTQALNLIAQALQIDHANAAARTLNNQVLAKMESTAVTALSAADQQRYNQAYTLYLKKSYQDALDIVLALWNDAKAPRNKTFGPLQKLKARIENALS